MLAKLVRSNVNCLMDIGLVADAKAFFVFDADHAQALWRHGRAGFGPIPKFVEPGDIRGLELAAAHVQVLDLLLRFHGPDQLGPGILRLLGPVGAAGGQNDLDAPLAAGGANDDILEVVRVDAPLERLGEHRDVPDGVKGVRPGDGVLAVLGLALLLPDGLGHCAFAACERQRL